MRAMVLVDLLGNEHVAVAATHKALKIWKAKKLMNLGSIIAWRYHDGSGWADGSPDAWKHINSIVSKKAEIVI
jgi:hypothetical protein